MYFLSLPLSWDKQELIYSWPEKMDADYINDNDNIHSLNWVFYAEDYVHLTPGFLQTTV